MELEEQLLPSSNVNMFPDMMFYDIIPQNNYPAGSYDIDNENFGPLKHDPKTNKPKNENVNITHAVKFPVSVMTPHLYKIVGADNSLMKQYRPRNTTLVRRDSYRPISPKDCDNNANSKTYSRDCVADTAGVKYDDSRYGLYRLGEQTLIFGKYSQSSPNIYSNIQYSSQGSHTNGHYKNRYYTNINCAGNTSNNVHGRQKQNRTSDQSRHGYASTDVMLRRAHGLVERFKSRADLMRIDPNPPGLLNGRPWDQLNQAIWDEFSSKAQKDRTYKSKISLWKNIYLYIGECLNSYGLFIVGSTMSGFGLETSDIDMCLLTKPCTNDPRLDALHHLNAIRHLLLKCGLTAEPELILAKVPILKFRDNETGFEIDLNCNNSVGIRNTHLLHCYARLDWRVRPLVVIVKLWAQANNINDAKNMTVSSYSWALMVILYLQCGVIKPVLPCLHALVPEKFNSDSEKHSMDVQEDVASIKNFKSDNTMCLGELLLGFFEYYSNFNYNEYAISVRAGSRLPIDECRFARAQKNDPHQWKYLCIEEPFDRTNTARSVFDLDVFKHICNVIIASYQELSLSKHLSDILPINVGQKQS